LRSLIALIALVALPVMANEPASDPTLYGRYEYVAVPQVGQTFKAKMDTGAMTSSLSAKDIERFKRDGDDWVRFRLATKDADPTLFEQPLTRVALIKNRAEEGDEPNSSPTMAERPVIDMEICVGNESRTIEVNLADRSHFDYPLLIGAAAMRKLGAAVNPAQRYTAERPEC